MISGCDRKNKSLVPVDLVRVPCHLMRKSAKRTDFPATVGWHSGPGWSDLSSEPAKSDTKKYHLTGKFIQWRNPLRTDMAV